MLVCSATVAWPAGNIQEQGLCAADCGPDKWEKFLGIQRAAGQNLHFMLLAEPNFSQIQGIRQGLDSAFPLSAKIGSWPPPLCITPLPPWFKAARVHTIHRSWEQVGDPQERGRWAGLCTACWH